MCNARFYASSLKSSFIVSLHVSTAGPHRKPLTVLGLVGDMDKEGDDGAMPLHEAHDKVQRQVRALHNQAFCAGLACRYQLLQRPANKLALRLVPLLTAPASEQRSIYICSNCNAY